MPRSHLELAQAAKLAVNENPALRLAGVSARLGVASRTLSRALEDCGGGTFGSLRRQALISRAQAALGSRPELLVKELAFELGFRSPAAFQRALKSASGVPPTKFRDEVRHPKGAPRGRSCDRSILILAPERDSEANAVAGELRRRRVRFERLAQEDLCGSVGSSLEFTSENQKLVLRGRHGQVDLVSVEAVWNRRPLRRPPPRGPQVPKGGGAREADSAFALGEARHFLLGLCHLLGEARWINAFAAQFGAGHKPYQLRVAQECGFRVPKTLITNEPKRAAEFFGKCGGEMIYKPLNFHFRPRQAGTPRAIFTNQVSKPDLRAGLERIRAAPCIFQELVPKRVEFRVTVIAGEHFTAEIDASESPSGRIDWRHYDMSHTKWAVGKLPDLAAGKVRRFMERMGLVFGCLDLIMTPAGEVVFLEINPAGQFLWLENLTGLPLLEAFTSFLAGTAGA